ncbi:hypothetical protein N181_20450 [Sinorhizobium fredii USDA 205]|nr:hypothetical protein N181_20450 [Sinorhizobium fredii USDA 205]
MDALAPLDDQGQARFIDGGKRAGRLDDAIERKPGDAVAVAQAVPWQLRQLVEDARTQRRGLLAQALPLNDGFAHGHSSPLFRSTSNHLFITFF